MHQKGLGSKRNLILAAALTLALTACFGPGVDPAILGEEGCRPPCWKGIVPGTTTESEAIEALQARRTPGPTAPELELQDEGLVWSSGPFGTRVRLEMEADLITALRLAPRRTRLTDAVAVLGQPEAFLGGAQGAEGYQLVVYYPTRGVVLGASGRAGSSPSGQPATAGLTVTAAFFTQPADLSSLLAAFHGPSPARLLLPYVRSWPER